MFAGFSPVRVVNNETQLSRSGCANQSSALTPWLPQVRTQGLRTRFVSYVAPVVGHPTLMCCFYLDPFLAFFFSSASLCFKAVRRNRAVLMSFWGVSLVFF